MQIRISPDVLSDLRLILGPRYHLKIDRLADTIAFGPVVGILVHPRDLSRIAKGKIDSDVRYHSRAAWDAHVFLYYFSHEHPDWDNLTTPGLVYMGRRWSFHEVPLPEVVYDLAFGFEKEEKPWIKHVRSRLRQTPGIQFVNSLDYLDKWGPFQHLSEHEGIRPHLPETVKYRGVDDLANLLGRYRQVFVKSRYGNRGEEVLAVKKSGPSSYLCETFDKKVTVGSLREVESIIKDFFVTDKLIVQQGISLLRHEGRRLVMRVLLHKDDAGQWRETYNHVWMAKKGKVITVNAEPRSFMSIMPGVLGSTGEALAKQREIADLSILIATQIESKYGPLGEIGVDVALDRQGSIWFLEANAKPTKDPEPFEKKPGPLLQFTRIFEYSRFLAGFAGPCGTLVIG